MSTAQLLSEARELRERHPMAWRHAINRVCGIFTLNHLGRPGTATARAEALEMLARGELS